MTKYRRMRADYGMGPGGRALVETLVAMAFPAWAGRPMTGSFPARLRLLQHYS